MSNRNSGEGAGRSLFHGLTDGFSQHCEHTVEIACEVERAYEAMCRLKDQPRIQSHVRSIDVVFDDGRFQELCLETVVRGVTMRMRTLLRCEPFVGVRFVQLEPPPGVRHHAGAYRLGRLGPDRCQVTAIQCWNLDGDVGIDEMRARFDELARLTLEGWKRHLEERQPHVRESIRIARPAVEVYGAFAAFSSWPRVLPHVRAVELVYDDGRHQELSITVERQGRRELVREVRLLYPQSRIEFFQPEPPELRQLRGEWSFEPDGERVTLATVNLRWVPDGEDATERLRARCRRDLELFKRDLES